MFFRSEFSHNIVIRVYQRYDNTQRKSENHRDKSSAPHEGKTQHDNMYTCSKKTRRLTEHLTRELEENGCQPLSRTALERIPAQFDGFLEEYEFGLIAESIRDVVENLGRSNQSTKKISSANYFRSTIENKEGEWKHKRQVKRQIQQSVLRRRKRREENE